MDYRKFFELATGNQPFRFQERFQGQHEESIVLRAPTGLGKTETVLVAWLYRRIAEPLSTPRRLAWCLPGRALTEQVAQVAERCIGRLVKAGAMESLPVYRLLGGSEDIKGTMRPDEAGVWVGTQDILLSRALNRGYARKPFRWPIDFALLNNDCFWVFDEVQLLGDGLATAAQLAAFREQFGVFGSVESCWISATLDPAWIATVDFRGPLPIVEPVGEDLQNEIVIKRVHAKKHIASAPETCREAKGIAEFVATEHRPGGLSLVISNTVGRAAEIRKQLEKRTNVEVRLLHSRFRPVDRNAHLDAVLSELPATGRIVVATQVIEAGIDLDASLLVTDMAPYASMVQRFGRVNRKGERPDSRIYWVDLPPTPKGCAPYDVAEVESAAAVLRGLVSGSPADLPPLGKTQTPWKHVLRRADLLDLFDTSTDLGGNEIDISRFVRSDPDRDVYVLWRNWDGDRPPNLPEIDDLELCPAPINEVDRSVSWSWDSVKGRWERPETVYPGLTLLMHVKDGKYTKDYGWLAASKTTVQPVPAGGGPIEPHDTEQSNLGKRPQTLAEHTQQVYDEMQRLVDALRPVGIEPHRPALASAARYHDWGKAHEVMQETLQGVAGPFARDNLLAKSAGYGKHKRRYFRHELASAVAMLESGESDLAAYVAAAHHGRIRVSMRSMPGERDRGKLCVRGIWDGESLLECSLGGGVTRPATVLRLSLIELGTGSWTELALGLRDAIGPFRLAYLEMLLRAADEAASTKGAQ